MTFVDTIPIFFILPLFLVLFITLYFTNKFITVEVYNVKYPEIDGLRGYLAFFVFLHHSYIWYYFLAGKPWGNPNSNLFSHFGQTSVVLFFIITAFLFMTKLLENKSRIFDWKKYFLSRFFRMFPIYIASILFIFFLVAIFTNFTLQTSLFDLTKSSLSWLFFSINGTPNINNYEDTFLINAGVTWTLPYEWMFYFLLPFFALALKIKVSAKILFYFGIGFLTFAIINQASIRHFIPFIGGIVVSFFINKKSTKIDFTKKTFTVIAILLLVLSIYFFESGRKPIPVIISSLVFLFIAKGNSFFGLFSNTLSRKFGQITYSLYLIHNIVIFLIFYGLLGIETAKKLSPIEFWLVISLSVIPIILISQITYLYIEKPFMNSSKK